MIKSKKQWGGNWTEEKLKAFEDYIKAYLRIMNTQKKKYNGWPTTIYFDGFAGSGSRGKEDSTSETSQLTIDDLNITLEEQNTYRGSAERVLELQERFDKYIFVDSDKDAINGLQENLENKNLITSNCEFTCDNVNKGWKNF